MKVKKYLSVFAVVCAGALTLAGCSDYDNGYNEAAIKFQEEFKNTFGDIDPEQDWNAAERATVTVNTQTSSNIKIYALRGSEYTLVGDYKGVNGTQMLGVDVIEGTRNLLVSDGRTAQKCIPGDVVVFNSMNTRTTHETTGGFIEVTKLWGPVDDLGDGKTYQKYRFSTEAEAKQAVDEKTGIVAQGKVNLHRVINNFSYVSNGPFIIYPYYWYTAAGNTVGIYYYDENDLDGNGNPKIKTVPVYTIKENNNGQDPELYYENIVNVDDREIWNEASANVYANVDNSWKDDDHKLWPDNWSVDNGVGKAKFHYNGWSNESGPVGNSTRTSYDGSGMTVPFTEYWVGSGTLTPGTLWREITGLTPGAEYRVEVQTRLWKENGGSSYPSGVYFFVERDGNKVAINQDKDEDGVPCYKTKTSYTYDGKTHAIVYGKSSLKGKADDNGKLKIGFIVNDGTDATWLAFKDLKVFSRKPQTEWESTNGKESFGTITRGQGIKVDIPVGTKFGMYLYSEYNNGNHTYYSEAELNTADKTNGLPENATYGYGKKYVGSGDITDKKNWVSDSQLYPCYASTFTVEGQMFFGFEDWAYPEGSDMDLNDVVLAVSGLTPTVINEDPTTSTWLLACEDLGGTFDRDYNDLVFKVDYISGQTTAKVTPLAAGGTLASYIFHVPESGSEQCLGEIHQLFGFEPAVSGEYEAHNVTGTSRGTEGQTVTIEVPSDWSMAYYSTDTYGLPQTGETGDEVDAGYQNMGGFEIRTLRKGTEAIANASANWSNITALSSGASRIPAPNRGEAPYIICLPYSYIEANTPVGYDTETFWAWPREFMNIDGCYLDFPKWVSKHNTYGTWYENKKDGAPTVDDLKIQRPRASALLPSQLGHNQETIYVVKNSSGYYDVNSYEDLRANLTGLSSGALHYYYYMHTWNQTEADKQVLNANDHLSNEDPRTIVVVQDADGTYEEGKTIFKMVVTGAAKVDANFQTRGQLVVWNNQEIWDWNTTGYAFESLTTGDKIKIETSLPSDATGQVTATLDEKHGTTGSILSEATEDGKKVFYFTAGPTYNTEVYIRINFAGDNKYNAANTTIRIKTVKSARIVRFKYSDGGTWALTHGGSGELKLQSYSYNNKYQMWRLEAHGQDDKGHNLYAFYNLGARKYLRLRSATDGHGDFESTYDTNNTPFYYFEIGDNNRLRVREFCRTNQEKYFGIEAAPSENLTVFLDKTVSYQIINWEAVEDVDVNTIHYNTSNAKKRM